MKACILSLILAIVSLSPCGCDPQAPAPAGGPDSRFTSNQEAKDDRPMTLYTAKQAFGRRALYLRYHKQPAPAKIWFTIPERTALYSYRDGERLGGVVGGWVFGYTDSQSNNHQARISCSGKITVTKETAALGKSYASFVRPDQWLLDNTDAHTIALKRGAIANSGNFGGG
jgi:hypothetical protein